MFQVEDPVSELGERENKSVSSCCEEGLGGVGQLVSTVLDT